MRNRMSNSIKSACFLINCRSGGGLGLRLFQQLQEQLPDAQICNLLEIDLGSELQRCAREQRTVIVCGGDGSIATVLDRVYVEELDLSPGLIPLGTGNDLARVLGCPGPKDLPLSQILEKLESARPRSLDRMYLTGPGISKTWYNYCSWGVDAEIALAFDKVRACYPALCMSANMNKILYAYLGLCHPGQEMSSILSNDKGLDGNFRSLVCANINSYAGGMQFGRQVSSEDQHFDIYALPHPLSLVSVLGGWRRLRHQVRCQEAVFELKQRSVLQCDGEAALAHPGVYTVSVAGQNSVLAADQSTD